MKSRNPDRIDTYVLIARPYPRKVEIVRKVIIKFYSKLKIAKTFDIKDGVFNDFSKAHND